MRQQVESAAAPQVTDGGRAALAYLHQAGVGESAQRLADRRPGDPEHLGQPPFAGQALAGGQTAAYHFADALGEDLVGSGPTRHRLQCHALYLGGTTGNRSSGQASSPKPTSGGAALLGARPDNRPDAWGRSGCGAPTRPRRTERHPHIGAERDSPVSYSVRTAKRNSGSKAAV